MTDPSTQQNPESKAPDRSEMWKALKWTAILLVFLLIAFGAFKAWQIATAPARVVGNATESVKSGATSILTRLEVPLQNQRRFDKAADAAFAHLNEMAETPPSSVKERGFRIANMRGARNRVCELSYDFGNGAVPVFLSADNAAHEAAKAVASNADRLIRIVVVSPEQTLGLNAEYLEDSKQWRLSWRPASVKKLYPDSWGEKPMTQILQAAPKGCG